MIQDRASLHLALFAAALAIALFAWVEISLRALDGNEMRATGKTVAPGLSIAVETAPVANVRHVALNAAP